MKHLFGLIIFLVFLTACAESYQKLDTKAFNRKIENRTDINTPEELIKAYYNYPSIESRRKVTIHSQTLSNNCFEITLIHEGIEDDSQSGEKIVMTAKRRGQTWNVIEIKRNWKCQKGRGHTGWGTSRCT